MSKDIFIRYKKRIPRDESLSLKALAQSKEGNTYTWEKKYEVVSQMHITGNMRLVSEMAGVPYDTVKAWKRQDWWKELEENIKAVETLEVNTKLKKIINKSLDVISDRLENGDVVLNNKTGELLKKPVSLRDANTAANTVLTHKRQIDKAQEEKTEKQESMKDVLSMLAKEFSSWNLRKDNATAIDVTPINKGEYNAPKEEFQQEGSEPEYQDGDEGREATEAGNSHSPLSST